jgi:hypothetical protein
MIFLLLLAVKLVGGSGPFEGYLYATNPATGIYGPVCDDYIDQNINGVSEPQFGLM